MQREQQSQNQTMERQHFQYQQNYQTSHQQQSYQTNHQQHQQHQQQYLTEDQQHMGTRSPLHIDTSSPPMLSTGIGSRSPARWGGGCLGIISCWDNDLYFCLLKYLNEYRGNKYNTVQLYMWNSTNDVLKESSIQCWNKRIISFLK